MIVVLNEWIFHDLLGDRCEAAQREAAEFLVAFSSSCDKLVLPKEPRWIEKAYRLMRQTDAKLRGISKQFHTLMRNSDRVIDVRNTAAEDVPKQFQGGLPTEDEYLVSAYLSAGADALVTTDQKLYEALVDSTDVSCRLRDEFLTEYHA